MAGNDTFFDEMKDRLLNRRQELDERLDAIKHDMSTPLDHDFAEQAVEQENGEVLQALGHEAELEIHQINRALIRMDEGRYGICDHCGTSIPAARLLAAPFSTYCLACASASEKQR